MKRTFFLFTFGVFALSLWFALFQFHPLVQKFQSAQTGSDGLVIDALWQRLQNTYHYGGFLIEKTVGSSFKTYNSQYGLQFKIFDFFRPRWISLEKYVFALHFLMIFFLAIILMLFIFSVWREFGIFSASAVFLSIMFSPWLILFSGSLYWLVFADFLPFSFAWAFYPHLRPRFWLFAFFIGLLVMFKALSGYEYITNVILSALVPIIYYELRSKSHWKEIATKISRLILVEILGFFIALVLHLFQLAQYFGSWLMAEGIASERFTVRTFGGIQNWPRSILDYLIGPAYLKTTLLSSISVTISSIITIGPFLLGLLLLYVLWKKKNIQFGAFFQDKFGALFIATAFSYGASLSWMVEIGHMVNHPHLNGIIFYLPANVMLFCLIGFLYSRKS